MGGVRTPSLNPVRPVREHARTVHRIPSPRSPEPDVTARPRRRRIAATVLTVLAGSLVFAALVLPREVGQLSPGAFLRIPAEGLLGLAILLVLTGRRRRIAATVGGAALGVLTLLAVLQMGFRSVLGRPFDPLFDWSQLGSGVALIESSAGRVGAVLGAVVLAAGLVVVMALAVRRLVGLAGRRRPATARAIALLAVAWFACFTFDAQIVASVPVASRSVASTANQAAQQVAASVAAQRRFEEQAAAVDPFAGVPASDLLTGLRGKDVVLTFVESYGRSALESPEFAPTVGAVLDDGTRRLAARGFASRSGFLSSTVAGGGSWLAHATLLSGLPVANQHSFDELVASDRLTLSSAFRRAGWETAAVMPSNTGPWAESAFYGFDRTYDSASLGNRSRTYSGFQTPDQYTLSAFERLERGRAGRGPLMAEIPLVTSHWPWADVPRLRDWNDLGDGSVFDGPTAGQSDPTEAVVGNDARMRDGFRRTIEYSLASLVSYVETYGDDDTVLVVLGDHQPAAFVAGEDAGHGRADHDHRPRPGRPRPDRRMGLAGRAAARPARAGLADGVLPRPVPDRVRAERGTRPLSRRLRAGRRVALSFVQDRAGVALRCCCA